jgi:SAM-dependent methyltransferase
MSDLSLAPPAALPSCVVCLGATFAHAFAKAGHRFDRCRRCGFVRIADPPPPEHIAQHYGTDRGYGEVAFQEHANNLKRFDELLATIERYAAPGKFLDVGCTIGTSLVAARARGWQTLGLEISKPAAEYGAKEHGLDIRSQTLAQAELPPESFDVVFMHHVLEHLERPDEVLAQAFRVLRKGGILYQSLPNWGCLKRRLLGSAWSYGVMAEHLGYFTPGTLARLLRRLGYEVVSKRTRSYREDPRLLHDLLDRFGMLPRFMQWCGRPGEAFDQQAYIRFITDKRWAWLLCNRVWPARLVGWLRLGEDMHVIARKPG